MKRLVLLGGGHAHVELLKTLAQRPLPDTLVTLVSPHAQVLYSGMLPGAIAGRYALADCAIALDTLAQRAHADRIEARASGIDPQARRVTLEDGRTLDYDVLSLDIGAAIGGHGIVGAQAHGLALRPLEPFWTGVQAIRERAARRFLGIVVVGGGAAAVEVALALQHRLAGQANVSLVTGGTAPLPDYAEAVRRKVRRALRRRAIRVVEDRCTELTGRQARLASGEGLACDAAILATGASAQAWLCDSGLALDPAGFVATGPTLQSVSHPDVFAVGDTASRRDRDVPRSGVYAVRAGPALARNLRTFLAGEAPTAHCPAARSLNLLSCGDGRAIAAWGRWSAQGRWVWWWKDRIDRRFVARYR